MSDAKPPLAAALPIAVRASFTRFLLMFVATTGMAGFFAWKRLHDPAHATSALTLVAVALGLAALAALYVLLDRRPRAEIDRPGITVRGWKGCPLAWSRIERVWKFQQRVPVRGAPVKVDYVCMTVRDPRAWRALQGPIARRFAAWSSTLGYGDLYFSTKGADRDADVLVAVIEARIGPAEAGPGTE